MKKSIQNFIAILFILTFTGCSVKKGAETVNDGLYVTTLAGLAIITAPVAIPLGLGMHGGKKTIMYLEYKDFKTSQSILDVHGRADKLYTYADKEIWAYYHMATNSEFEHNVFFLIHNNNVLDYYSDLENVEEWDKYKLKEEI